MRTIGATRILAGLFMAALLLGCTGSNAGLVTPMISGDYALARLGEDAATGATWSDGAAIRFDGEGAVQADATGDGSYQPAGSYSINADRTVALDGDTTGIFSRAINVLVTGKLSRTPEINIGAAVRTVRGVGSEVLHGSYVLCLAGGDTNTGACWTSLRSGFVSELRLQWVNLAYSEPMETGGTWKVDAFDSILDVRALDGTPLFRGGITFDGGIFVALGQSGAPNQILVGIRRDDRIGTPSFQGAYLGYSFGADLGSCHTSRFELGADGIGLASLLETRSDGLVNASSFDYTVESGFLLADGLRIGALSADGNVLAGVDADASDGSVDFFLAVRKE